MNTEFTEGKPPNHRMIIVPRNEVKLKLYDVCKPAVLNPLQI